MKYDCIILAAGLSSRMGKWKPGIEIGGKSLIRHAVDNASDGTADILVVGGYRIDDLRNSLDNFNNVQMIENLHYEKGMITSVKAALAHIRTDRFFITLADMPFISPHTYMAMSEEDFDEVLFPVYEGRRGHPVLLDRSLVEEILRAPDSLRMKDILLKKRFSEISVDDPGILMDLDSPEDIERIYEKS